ncbi:MAG: 3-isopropylmalate dehydratase large subunit [Anaerolineae bacterium]|nr:3-isopropylmalate dehydratase large subunit [Anaerolineae bacterium]
MGQTTVEKIISKHAASSVRAGDLAIVDVDGVMATDATGPFTIKAFRDMGGIDLWDAERVSLILDHATPAPNERISNLHQMLRDFANESGCHFYDVGEGICHQLMVENGHVKPGDLFLGADSHSPTYGGLNAFAAGVGSTDLAAVMLTGKTWLKVPETIRIELVGQLPKGLTAKDMILFLVGQIGIAGATYMAVEFTGEAIRDFTLASRMVLANMVAEMGAKTGLVDPTNLELWYDWEATYPDDDAKYAISQTFDVSQLKPQVARPHLPSHVSDIDVSQGKKIQQAFIGSCTNARLEDLQMAARVLKGKKIARTVRLLVAPASRKIFNAALADGTIQILSDAGATFLNAGCGPCVGTLGGIPADGEVIISSTNRNFQGRMGNPNAEIYLSSPAVVAASALTGEITNPADILNGNTDWEIL